MVFCGRNGVEEEIGGLFELKVFGGVGIDGRGVSLIFCSLFLKLSFISFIDL